MNDKKFIDKNWTGLHRKVNQGKITIPKEIRESNELSQDSMVEIIPMHEGFYVLKARKE